MQPSLKFKLPDGHNAKQFFGQLADRYALIKEPAVTDRFTICDTFDWRLFNKSLVLCASGNRLFLRKLAENEILYSAEIPSFPVFMRDFPDSELQRRLAPIIRMRALLKLADVQSRSVPYRILNPDKKTVARLAYEEFRPGRRKNKSVLVRHLWLKPVKGYSKYMRTLTRLFQEAGLKISKEEDVFFKALEGVDKKPDDYSAKLNIQLDPDMRSDEATKIILRFLLRVMRINQANIEKDLDTEFLHDFRVAVRRTRSALGQIKNVFPVKTTDRFKNDFAFVGKLSNELRDLDVYLLNEAKYKAMLPPMLRDAIDPLFDHLRKKRSKALQNVIRGLKTKKYATILKDWEAFLNTPHRDSMAASNAKLPVIDLSRNRIYKKYSRVVKVGSQILANTEDEMLHVLRIHCKKLRYLMEFFASLFPRKKINVLIAQLKKLQDNLGDFNDLCVQEEYLLNIIRELPATHGQLKTTLVAIGGLVGTLGRERQIVRDAFADTFTDFSSSGNKQLFQELFASKAKEDVS